MNYRIIFKHIHAKGYEGVLCMEHGRSLPGGEGIARVIAAYREVDEFI
jgi:hydroxypyruvate isomerase